MRINPEHPLSTFGLSFMMAMATNQAPANTFFQVWCGMTSVALLFGTLLLTIFYFLQRDERLDGEPRRNSRY